MKVSLEKSLPAFSILFAFLIPVLTQDPYYQHTLNVAFLFAISVYGFNIITGITGQFNIAHAGFIGIGAYVSALATTKFLLSFWIALPLAILVTGIFRFADRIPFFKITRRLFCPDHARFRRDPLPCL